MKKDGLYICPECGTGYEIEDAKGLMVDVPDEDAGEAEPRAELRAPVEVRQQTEAPVAVEAKPKAETPAATEAKVGGDAGKAPAQAPGETKKQGCGCSTIIVMFLIVWVLGSVSSLFNCGGWSSSGRDADIGDRVSVSGRVIKTGSTEFWVDGNDGLEYKCWPYVSGAIQTLSPGDRITVKGKVRSKSAVSVNLEGCTW